MDARDAAVDASRPDAVASEDAFAPINGDRDIGPRVAPPGEPPAGVVVCGTAFCAESEECCLLDLRCVPIGDPSCAPPVTSEPDACARESDCGRGEACVALEATGEVPGICGGALGHCVAEPELSWCAGTGPWTLCGCDGRTYFDPCDAARAGVRIANRVACGASLRLPSHGCESDADCAGIPHTGACDLTIGGRCVEEDLLFACGIHSECPSGQACCAISGACFDPARPAACASPPEGTVFPCADDTDCARYDGSYWGGTSIYYCDGEGCGISGGCRPPPSECAGVIATVCGCDGVTYQNECEAHRARARIAHDGEC